MILFQRIVNQKLNNITTEELMQYASQYNIPIGRPQAVEVVKLIRGKNINLFNQTERGKLLQNIANITSPRTAEQVNQIFMQFIG
ncbi:DUF2624 domain-containing protein [Metabacillus herbersteinensis]|uniref:DUF2624 domain-containing protein n=1 Tax=Metabacillus herbersteinensis TaxID=283816 RepID=A0ABV6G8M7_9BACI